MTDWLGRWSDPGIFVCVFIGNFGIPVCGELLICVENQQFAATHRNVDGTGSRTRLLIYMGAISAMVCRFDSRFTCLPWRAGMRRVYAQS